MRRVVYLGPETEKRIIDSYLNNVAIDTIAGDINVSSQKVRDIINKYIQKGVIKERGRINPYRHKPKPKEEKKPVEAEEEEIVYAGDGWVRCTREISLTCVYGATENSSKLNMCNYILCTNTRRGCPWQQCSKYQKVDENHPRLYQELAEPPRVQKKPDYSDVFKRYRNED